MRPRHLKLLCLAVVLATSVSAKAQEGTRTISTDFTKNRPAAGNVAGGSVKTASGRQTAGARKPRVYRQVSKTTVTTPTTKPTSSASSRPVTGDPDISQRFDE